jgi:hypothetical protein
MPAVLSCRLVSLLCTCPALPVACRLAIEANPPPIHLPNYPTHNQLLAHPNVTCTPHLGASTEEAQINVAKDIAVQVCARPFVFRVCVPCSVDPNRHTGSASFRLADGPRRVA